MGWFAKQTPAGRNPFGVTEHDELGMLHDESGEEQQLYEVIGKRGKVSARAGSFVGNIIAHGRYRKIVVALVVVFGVFLARAGWLQIVHGETYRALADANRIRTIVLPAARGVIVDRNGVELANNSPSFTLVGHKSALQDALAVELPNDGDEREEIFFRAAELVHGDAAVFAQAYDAAGQGDAFPLLLDVPYEQAITFAVHDTAVRGIDLVLGAQRSYITDTISTLSHVLGYTGIISTEEYDGMRDEGYLRYDRVGKQGIERTYESVLRGSFGKEIVEVDSEGFYIRTIAKEDAIDGEPLVLTIDVQLQAYIEQSLKAHLTGATASRASVVAMDPRNGQVLALASWPSYDANVFAQGIDATAYAALLADEDHPLFPRAHAGEYPAGSTIKPVYAAAALTEDIVTPSTSFVSSGGLQIGNRFFPDWRGGGHGVTNIYHAIADSVNTYFYIIGGGYDTFQGLGIDRLMSWASTFGFGEKSGIDLPSEGEGFLPSKAWKEAEKGEPWYIGDTYNVSIGQGDFLVTPVQMARATSVFANGGSLVTPYLNMDNAPIVENILASDVTEVVKNAMRQTVVSGSAKGLQSVPVDVAGKTGTAQWSNSSPPHAWFTGFAPFDSPSIVLTVIIEDGGDEHVLDIPIARDVLSWYFSR